MSRRKRAKIAVRPGERAEPDVDLADIGRRIVAHFRATCRELPWRETRDPYAIWVSEVMLQQTRVATVIPYYRRWLDRFPTVEALAAAPIDDVLAAWSGLGYYSRARNLRRGAAEVMARYGGRVPDDPDQLRALPGVGAYTAGAIASIAFGRPEPVVDGNVARVLARVFAIDDDIKAAATRRRLWDLAARLVPADAPGDFNQGIMELGATVCTPRAPRCGACPLSGVCRARAAGRASELPVTRPRRRAGELPVIDVVAAWLVRRRRVLLVRRAGRGLYAGLWELPQAPTPDGIGDAIGLRIALRGSAPAAAHEQLLSHRRLRIRVWRAAAPVGRVRPSPDRYDAFRWCPPDAIGDAGVSAATAQIARAMVAASGGAR